MNEKILNKIKLKNFLKEVEKEIVDCDENEITTLSNTSEYLLQTIFTTE